jgi:hypothetical protein
MRYTALVVTPLLVLVVGVLLFAGCATASGGRSEEDLGPSTYPATDFDGDDTVDWHDTDDDNDGVSDVEEIEAETDPRDPSSVPED